MFSKYAALKILCLIQIAWACTHYVLCLVQVPGEMTFSGDGSVPSDGNGRLKSYFERLNTLLKEKVSNHLTTYKFNSQLQSPRNLACSSCPIRIKTNVVLHPMTFMKKRDFFQYHIILIYLLCNVLLKTLSYLFYLSN